MKKQNNPQTPDTMPNPPLLKQEQFQWSLDKLRKSEISQIISAQRDDRISLEDSVRNYQQAVPIIVTAPDAEGIREIIDGCGRFDALVKADAETALCVETASENYQNTVLAMNYDRRKVTPSMRLIAYLTFREYMMNWSVQDLVDATGCRREDVKPAKTLLRILQAQPGQNVSVGAYEYSADKIKKAAQKIYDKVMCGDMCLVRALAALGGEIANPEGGSRPRIDYIRNAVAAQIKMNGIFNRDTWFNLPSDVRNQAEECLVNMSVIAPPDVMERLRDRLDEELDAIAKREKAEKAEAKLQARRS